MRGLRLRHGVRGGMADWVSPSLQSAKAATIRSEISDPKDVNISPVVNMMYVKLPLPKPHTRVQLASVWGIKSPRKEPLSSWKHSVPKMTT